MGAKHAKRGFKRGEGTRRDANDTEISGETTQSHQPEAGSDESEHNQKPWYFGSISRQEAERFLTQTENADGAFLVRQTENKTGVEHVYTLSVRKGMDVKHLKIRRQYTGYLYIEHGTYFPSLVALIDNLENLRQGVEGLTLKQPCSQWEVPYSTLNMQETISESNFAEVYKGSFKGETVAIKRCTPAKMKKETVDNELKVLKGIGDSKLIRMLAFARNGSAIFMVMEYMEHGNLLNYLQTRGLQRIGYFQQVDIGAQVASGMAYLEASNYVHSDLAARNVLVADDTQKNESLNGNKIEVKITDFGLAKLLTEKGDNQHQNTKLPIKWTAPEVLVDNRFTSKSDVWSFGIFLSEVMTYGKTPYHGSNNQEVASKIKGGFHMDQKAACPKYPAVFEIMESCWRMNPEERPTFATLQWKLEGFFTEEDPYESPAAMKIS